jgi:hypothetical protein
MNFIIQSESTPIQRELKYCERCGGLFLRSASTRTSYCAPCQAHWVKLAQANELIFSKSRATSRKMRSTRNKKRPHARLQTIRGCIGKVCPC